MSPGQMKPFVVSLLIALSLAAGCGRELRHRMAPNQAPEVVLDRPQLVTTNDQALAYSVSWKARDGDGRVDHYLYAFDPASIDRVDESWTRSRETSTRFQFARRSTNGRVTPASLQPRDAFHVFALRAVDDQGAQSPTVTQVVFEDNVAPQVTIENPRPNAFFTPITNTTLTIRWRGEDPDGQIVRYKYRLFSRFNPDFPEIQDFIELIRIRPDTLRGLYGPDFESWDEAGPGKTSVQYTDLVPNQIYVFAITAIDNRGAYDAVFDPNRNLVKFAVVYPGTLGPQVCVATSFFNYCQSSANTDAPAVEFPADQAIPVSWVAFPPLAAEIAAYRWALDPEEPLDDSRSHWSPWRLENTSTTLGPFAGGEQHVLVIQAKDSNDLTSTMRVPFTVVGASFTKDLLVVDDTRLTPDQRDASGGIGPPRGSWPTAAELDTFLYARGGVPWRAYPEGTLSQPGILAGYSFDTLGTRGLPGGVVPLSVLSRYRHVMWMTDDVGSTYTGSPQEQLAPITSLALMSSPGQQSTLATYVQQGGKVWLHGGGAAYATLRFWQRARTAPDEFTNQDNELITGRFMYDFAYWRSGVKISPAERALLNVPQVVGDPTAAPGRGWPGQPLYQKLETGASVLAGRTCASDPPSPLRICNSFYLVRFYTAEFLFVPNAIVEDQDPRPNHEHLASVLDTIYVAAGGQVIGQRPVMTYYHGSQSPPMVFSGFPVWHFRRAQCADLTDFVLQDIWGLVKQPSAGLVASAARSEKQVRIFTPLGMRGRTLIGRKLPVRN